MEASNTKMARISSTLLGYAMAMENQKPYMAMIFVQIVYAGMALFSKAAISKGVNPFVFVVYRQAFATLSLAPFAFFFESGKAAPLSYTLVCKIFFISLIGIALSLNLYYVAINFTSATFAAATPSTIPAITFLIAALLRMERVCIGHVHGVAKVVGSAMCVSGALVYAFVKGPPLNFMVGRYTTTQIYDSHSANITKDCIKGSLMMLSANTAWSFWLIMQGVVVKEYPAKLRLTALECFFSCLQSAFCAFFMDPKPHSWNLGWNLHLLSAAYCGIIVGGITYWMQVWTIEKKGPVFTALFTPLSLIITALFSAFLWKEALYWGSVGGSILLGGGLYGVLWGKNREEKRDQINQKITQLNKEEESVVHCVIHH